MENKQTAEEKLVSVKAKLLEEIERHRQSIEYGVRTKAKKTFENDILKADKSKANDTIPVQIPKANWDSIVDFVRFVMKDEWNGFNGYPDSEVYEMRIKKEVLKTLY
jgi:hypothetical protein